MGTNHEDYNVILAEVRELHDKMNALYNVIQGKLGEPGMVSKMEQMFEALLNPLTGVCHRLDQIEQQRAYGKGWLAGASAIGGAVVWLLGKLLGH